MIRSIIDTSNNKLIIFFLEDKKVIFSCIKHNLIKQTENLPIEFEKGLTKLNLKVAQIKEFYVTVGPGSFTGSRVALAYIKPIAFITSAKLFTTTSLHFIAGPSYTGKIRIDAKSGLSYEQSFKNGKPTSDIQLVKNIDFTNWDTTDLENCPFQYLHLFCETPILKALPIYIKKPNLFGGSN